MPCLPSTRDYPLSSRHRPLGPQAPILCAMAQRPAGLCGSPQPGAEWGRAGSPTGLASLKLLASFMRSLLETVGAEEEAEASLDGGGGFVFAVT